MVHAGAQHAAARCGVATAAGRYGAVSIAAPSQAAQTDGGAAAPVPRGRVSMYIGGGLLVLIIIIILLILIF